MDPVEQQWGGAAVAESVPVAPLTTLRVGPVARRVITCVTTDHIVQTLQTLDHTAGQEPVLVLGGGSNVVIDDGLTDLTVVRLATNSITVDGNAVRAEAGANWDDVVSATVASGLGGLECLSGIPGSAGATPVQNVGAYGIEVAELLTRVRLYDRHNGQIRWVTPDELGFGYRHSVLKNSSDAVVLEVEFALNADGRSAPVRYGELASALGMTPGDRGNPADIRSAVLELRGRKGMVLDEADHDTWSVGSFFTNPVVAADQFDRLQTAVLAKGVGPVPNYPAPDGVKLAAGWLVEKAGFGKGYPGGHPGSPEANCRLSTKHALALTNRGRATSADVLQLARTVRNGVFDVFGITLKPEPVLVGCVL